MLAPQRLSILPGRALFAAGALVAAWMAAILGVTSARAGNAEVTVLPASVVDLAGSAIELVAVPSGGEPNASLQWSLSGTPISGATDQTLLIPDLQSLSAGAYTAALSGSSSAASAPSTVAVGLGYAFTTLAGVPSGSGDGAGPAARFESPSAVAVDSAGNTYVADTGNDTIRMITSGGVVTTLAGSPGAAGSSDGTGPAARFDAPSAIAVDASGNIYVADTGNDTIRMIASGGVVTTLAGTADSPGSTDGTGTMASFNSPSGLAVDGSGNIYVADTGNDTIRMIASGGVVTTLAGTAGSPGSTDGTGSLASFNSPTGIAVSSGTLYVADSGNRTVRMVATGGVVTTLAGIAGSAGSANGAASAATFNSPSAVAVDGSGNIFVADSGNDTIREIAATTEAVTTFAGSTGVPGGTDGRASAALFNEPTGVAVGPGGIYVADSANDAVRLVSGSTVSTLAGTESSGTANGTGPQARFLSPTGIAVDASGNIYVADPVQSVVRAVSPAGAVSALAGGSVGSSDGTGPAASFNGPRAIAVDATGNLYVADTGNDTIREIAPGGVVTTMAGTAGLAGSADGTGKAARFNSPTGVAVDGSGNVYVADSGNGTIRMITPAGLVTTLAGTAGVAGYFDAAGPEAQFDGLGQIAADPSGNVYAAENSGTIRKITGQGVVSTVAGIYLGLGDTDGAPDYAQFNFPQGIAVDGGGNLYVADSGNEVIRMIDPTGTVSTLAGNAGVPGGSDGQGSAAEFLGPGQIAVDPIGNLYVADTGNHSVRTGSPPHGQPSFTVEPSTQSVALGASATLTIAAAGNPSPSVQWYLNGVPIPGATSSSLTVTGASSSAAGSYFAVASNSVGQAVSTVATLSVGTGSAPVIVTPPVSENVVPGSNASFTVSATGTAPLAYQWNFNGSPIAGATSQTLTIPNAGSGNDGSYSVTVSSVAGSTTSAAATLDVTAQATGPRLINLSARATVGTSSDVLIAGFYISGSGQKNMIVRGVGPTLAQFGVPGYLTQPGLDLFNQASVQIASDNGWMGSSSLSAGFVSVGAFPFLTNSADSALELGLSANASYTAEVVGANGGTGVALAELYDADANADVSSTRLANISARANVPAGGTVIAGFVVGGVGNETVLIRGVGPTLAEFGLANVLATPVLTLYDSGGNVISSDEGWENPVSPATGPWAGVASPANATHSVFTSVSAFDLPDGSADSAMVVSLPPGAYTAQVTGAGGSSGVTLAEIYELPQ